VLAAWSGGRSGPATAWDRSLKQSIQSPRAQKTTPTVYLQSQFIIITMIP
jgi:hypothetical protein